MSGSMTTTAPAVDLFALPPLPAGTAAVIAVGVPGVNGAPGTAYQAPLPAAPSGSAGVTSFNGRSGAVSLGLTDISSACLFTPYNGVANPLNFQTLNQVSAAIATAISGLSASVVSFNGRTGAILLSGTDVTTAQGFTSYSAANPSNYQTAAQVSAAIQGVVGAAPAALSTLQQIAAELLNDESAASALTATVATKLSRTSNLSDLASPATARTNLGLAAVASSGSYTDLVNQPAPFSLPQASMSVAGGVKVDGTSIVISSSGVISAPGAAGSVMTVALSQHGIVSDAVNGLEWGVSAPAGAGQEAAINALIASSVAAAAASGATGVKIVWDVAVALGAPVFVMSNMTVECPHYGCGAIVRAGANCPIFMVNGMQANMNGGVLTGVGAVATQNTFGMFDPAFQGSPNQQYHRVFSPAFVNATNLAILGGTWNGNYFQQTTQPPGTQGSLPFIVADNIGYTSIMHLFGVNGLTLRGLHCSNGTHFGLYFVNVANAVIEDCTVDQY